MQTRSGVAAEWRELGAGHRTALLASLRPVRIPLRALLQSGQSRLCREFQFANVRHALGRAGTPICWTIRTTPGLWRPLWPWR